MKNKARKILLVIFSLIFIYSIYNVFVWKQNVDDNNRINKEINEIYVQKKEVDEDQKIIVDIDALKKINEDVVAYISMNNTKINYVVVKGEDNDYYLDHNFNKKKNRSGWIFADYHNKFDDSDKNIVIYGHNTADGSMFGTLRNVYKKEWNNNISNRIISLVTESGYHQYQVFSSYSFVPEDYYITTEFKNDNEYQKFLNVLKRRSFYNYKTDVSKDDSILTLSTCTSNGNKRLVMHAKKIN